tara:strand:+ start:19239 stop:19499 length:261 start_codon:yes stop_codon:yes gene_type:complete
LKTIIFRLSVVGSVTTDNFTASSDVDVLISFKDISFEKYIDNYFELHHALEELFNRKVDLITVKSISNPFFISEIEKTKKLLCAAA